MASFARSSGTASSRNIRKTGFHLETLGEFERPESVFDVYFGGTVETVQTSQGRYPFGLAAWRNHPAVAYDTAVVGWAWTPCELIAPLVGPRRRPSAPRRVQLAATTSAH
jgi:hypothetical protein